MASSAIEIRSPAVSSMSSSRPRRQRADLLGEVEQLVGGVAHRRHDDHDVVAGLAGVDDALGDPLDALGVGDRRAAVLLHDQAHDGPPRRTTCRRAPPVYGRARRGPDRPSPGPASGSRPRRARRDGRSTRGTRVGDTPGEARRLLRGRLRRPAAVRTCVTSWTVSASRRSSTRIVSSIGVSSRTCETTECSARSAERRGRAPVGQVGELPPPQRLATTGRPGSAAARAAGRSSCR